MYLKFITVWQDLLVIFIQLYSLAPNFVVERIEILLRVLEIPVSNLGLETACLD
jgi:hypothetical protein